MPDDVIAMLDDYPLPKVDDLRFVGPSESFDAKKTAFLKMLGEALAGADADRIQPSDRFGRFAADHSERRRSGLEPAVDAGRRGAGGSKAKESS